MREVQTRVRLVVGVLEVVDPCRRVGIYVYDVCVEEIVVAGELTAHCLTDYLSVLAEISRVLRDYRKVGRDGKVGVVFAARRVETVLSLCRRRVVVYLVAVVELCRVELALAGDRVCAVYALYGPQLILVCVAPRNRLVPVEVRLDRVALLVLFDFESLVASESGVGEAFADYGIPHPEDELLVFGVGDFSLVHPEGVYGYTTGIPLHAPH